MSIILIYRKKQEKQGDIYTEQYKTKEIQKCEKNNIYTEIYLVKQIQK